MATGFVSALLRIREESDNRPEPNRSIVAKQILQISKSAAVAGISYYLGTRIGFAFTPNGQPNSAFWPPNAILLAVFLLTPKEIWWSVFLTVIPAHLLAQLQAGVPVWTSIGCARNQCKRSVSGRGLHNTLCSANARV